MLFLQPLGIKLHPNISVLKHFYLCELWLLDFFVGYSQKCVKHLNRVLPCDSTTMSTTTAALSTPGSPGAQGPSWDTAMLLWRLSPLWRERHEVCADEDLCPGAKWENTVPDWRTRDPRTTNSGSCQGQWVPGSSALLEAQPDSLLPQGHSHSGDDKAQSPDLGQTAATQTHSATFQKANWSGKKRNRGKSSAILVVSCPKPHSRSTCKYHIGEFLKISHQKGRHVTFSWWGLSAHISRKREPTARARVWTNYGPSSRAACPRRRAEQRHGSKCV